MDWDGIERTRSNKQGMSALLLKRIRFLAGSVCFLGVGGNKLASSQAYPPKKETDPIALRVLSIPSHSIPGWAANTNLISEVVVV